MTPDEGGPGEKNFNERKKRRPKAVLIGLRQDFDRFTVSRYGLWHGFWFHRGEMNSSFHRVILRAKAADSIRAGCDFETCTLHRIRFPFRPMIPMRTWTTVVYPDTALINRSDFKNRRRRGKESHFPRKRSETPYLVSYFCNCLNIFALCGERSRHSSGDAPNLPHMAQRTPL